MKSKLSLDEFAFLNFIVLSAFKVIAITVQHPSSAVNITDANFLTSISKLSWSMYTLFRLLIRPGPTVLSEGRTTVDTQAR